MLHSRRRGTQKPPEWGLDVETRMKRLGLTKIALAQMLGINYTHMNSVITGSRISPPVKEKILQKIADLESGVE